MQIAFSCHGNGLLDKSVRVLKVRCRLAYSGLDNHTLGLHAVLVRLEPTGNGTDQTLLRQGWAVVMANAASFS